MNSLKPFRYEAKKHNKDGISISPEPCGWDNVKKKISTCLIII